MRKLPNLEFSADLPDPLPLMTKISEADPPTLDPSGHLLHIGKARQEVQLLLGFGLGQETVLKIYNSKFSQSYKAYIPVLHNIQGLQAN